MTMTGTMNDVLKMEEMLHSPSVSQLDCIASLSSSEF